MWKAAAWGRQNNSFDVKSHTIRWPEMRGTLICGCSSSEKVGRGRLTTRASRRKIESQTVGKSAPFACSPAYAVKSNSLILLRQKCSRELRRPLLRPLPLRERAASDFPQARMGEGFKPDPSPNPSR